MLNLKKNFTNIEATTSDPGYENCEFMSSGAQMIIKGDKLKINGIDFCVFPDVNHGVGQVDVDYSYITKRNGKYFTVKLTGGYASSGFCQDLSCKDFGDVKKMFDQILSTFKFID